MKPRIVLATLNARYSHASFGLRYLLANLGPWRSETRMREFTIHQPPLEIVERLLDDDPTLIGLGIYIWNLTETTAIMRLLRALRPDLTLVIGGPEVSYEYEGLEAFQLADHLIPGEADLAFRQLVDDLSAGERPPKVIDAPLPDVTALSTEHGVGVDVRLTEHGAANRHIQGIDLAIPVGVERGQIELIHRRLLYCQPAQVGHGTAQQCVYGGRTRAASDGAPCRYLVGLRYRVCPRV